MVGGVGILVAVVLSTIALVISASDHDKTVTVQAAAAGHADRARQGAAPHGRRARRAAVRLGQARRRRHRLRLVPHDEGRGRHGTMGPNLDKELTADPASATRESIVDPNKEIVPGYSANVMPTNYGTAFTSRSSTRSSTTSTTAPTPRPRQASRGEDHEHPVSDRHAGAVTRRTAGRVGRLVLARDFVRPRLSSATIPSVGLGWSRTAADGRDGQACDAARRRRA